MILTTTPAVVGIDLDYEVLGPDNGMLKCKENEFHRFMHE